MTTTTPMITTPIATMTAIHQIKSTTGVFLFDISTGAKDGRAVRRRIYNDGRSNKYTPRAVTGVFELLALRKNATHSARSPST